MSAKVKGASPASEAQCVAQLNRMRSFAAVHRLSEREQEVLLLLLSGVPPKAMGERLGCEYTSVRTHLGRMFKKLKCSGTLELVLRFFGEVQ